MGAGMKRKNKASELQRRRLKAGRLLLKGVTQAEVARRVGVSRPTVFAWTKRLQQGGLAALSNGVRGRPSRLDNAKREQLAQALMAGARAHGYATELWTLPRIAKLIEQRFGFSYSISQVSRLLAAMGWSCQRPDKRALQRDEKAIARWKDKRWPALKKRRCAETNHVFIDESGLSERPTRVRTWSPKAQTPVLQYRRAIEARGFYRGAVPQIRQDRRFSGCSIRSRSVRRRRDS